MGFEPMTFQFTKQEGPNLVMGYGVGDDNQYNVFLLTNILLDKVSVLLVLEFVS